MQRYKISKAEAVALNVRAAKLRERIKILNGELTEVNLMLAGEIPAWGLGWGESA